MARKPTYEELEQRVKELEKESARRKRAEDKLRKSEEKFAAVVENAKEGIMIIQDDRTVYVNPRVEQLSPFSREEIFSEDFPYFIHPEDRTTMIQRYLQVKKGKRFSVYHDYRVLDKEGNIRWVTVNSTSTNYRGKPAVLVFLTEITQRKRREEALRESEKKYRSILENIEEGYYEVDTAGNFTFFNDSMCKVLGYSKEELLGMNNRQVMDQDNAKKMYQTFNKVFITGTPDKATDWEIIRKDGGKRHIEVSVSLMKDKEGLPTGFQGIAGDITEKKLLRHQE
jgi:PAS domain S-box-containing protein